MLMTRPGSATYGLRARSGPSRKIIWPASPCQLVLVVG